jgi:hypothetical protein
MEKVKHMSKYCQIGQHKNCSKTEEKNGKSNLKTREVKPLNYRNSSQLSTALNIAALTLLSESFEYLPPFWQPASKNNSR